MRRARATPFCGRRKPECRISEASEAAATPTGLTMRDKWLAITRPLKGQLARFAGPRAEACKIWAPSVEITRQHRESILLGRSWVRQASRLAMSTRSCGQQ